MKAKTNGKKQNRKSCQHNYATIRAQRWLPPAHSLNLMFVTALSGATAMVCAGAYTKTTNIYLLLVRCRLHFVQFFSAFFSHFQISIPPPFPLPVIEYMLQFRWRCRLVGALVLSAPLCCTRPHSKYEYNCFFAILFACAHAFSYIFHAFFSISSTIFVFICALSNWNAVPPVPLPCKKQQP